MTASLSVSKDRTTLPLLAFVVCLLFLSHTATSSYTVDDGDLLLMVPHHLLPLSLATSFLSSLFPLADTDNLHLLFPASSSPSSSSALPCPPLPSVDPLLYLHPCNLTSSSPVPSTPSSASLASILSLFLSPTHEPSVLLTSLLTLLALTLLFLALIHHPHTHPYMLPGSRPTLPQPVLLTALPPRLGHRVGSKRGRKLSAVEEEDGDSGSEDVEGEEEDRLMNLGRESGVDWSRRQQLERARRSSGCVE